MPVHNRSEPFAGHPSPAAGPGVENALEGPYCGLKRGVRRAGRRLCPPQTQTPESILKSWIDMWHQVGAGFIRVRFRKRRRGLRVRVGIRGRQFRVWILHQTGPDLLDLEHAFIGS
jgi:hypothetical protein